MQDLRLLTADEIMLHDTRKRIYECIRDEPGITFYNIKDLVGVSNGELTHHLKVMEENRIIKSLNAGQFKKHFIYEYCGSKYNPLTEREFKVLSQLMKKKMKLTDIVRATGIPQPTVYRILNVLKNMNLVICFGGKYQYTRKKFWYS